MCINVDIEANAERKNKGSSASWSGMLTLAASIPLLISLCILSDRSASSSGSKSRAYSCLTASVPALAPLMARACVWPFVDRHRNTSSWKQSAAQPSDPQVQQDERVITEQQQLAMMVWHDAHVNSCFPSAAGGDGL